MELKSKFLATIFNIKRIQSQSNINPAHLNLGDFITGNFFHNHNDSSLTLKTQFGNLHFSFLYNDLAIFYADYLEKSLLVTDNSVLIRQVFEQLVEGYQSQVNHSIDLELFKFLCLFQLQLKIIDQKSNKTHEESSKRFFENAYLDLYDLDVCFLKF